MDDKDRVECIASLSRTIALLQSSGQLGYSDCDDIKKAMNRLAKGIEPVKEEVNG